MTDALDSLRDWIGRTEQASDVVTSRLVQGLRATLDQDARVPEDGEPAPLAIHWCLAPPTLPQSHLGLDGHPERGGFLPPVPLPRRMWAGGALELHDRLRVGDRVVRRSRIASVEGKQGRTGTLVFVAVDHVYETDRGLALAERHDIVYREATAGHPEPVRETRAPDLNRILVPDPVLLFRYSALTFNGHRIHYDRRHCIDAESYPGLVVHAPLQATLLLELTAEAGGSPPRRFRFRGVHPLFDGAPCTLNALRTEDGSDAWVADHEGRTTTTAQATW